MPECIHDIISNLHSTLPKEVELVAVSKFQPVEAIREAYGAGQRTFGESRVAELISKASELPGDIKWHFIGHLQTNKVRSLVGKVTLIESVDSERLINLIDKESERCGVVSDVLMQVHVAAEETKFGWLPDELLDYFREGKHRTLKATRIRGIMGMATNTDDEARIEADFKQIAQLRQQIVGMCPDLTDFDIVSMGMSDDYPLAIRHGATHVRIGSRIFGARNH